MYTSPFGTGVALFFAACRDICTGASAVATKIFANLPGKSLDQVKGFFSAPGYPFNPQFSNQNGACRVVKDGYGAFWQIVPRAIDGLLGSGDPARSHRVMTAMLKKIDLPTLQRAFA